MLTMDKKLSNFDYFIFDLDGTLYNDKKEILPSTSKWLKELQNRGKNIIIATGRPYYMNYQLIHDLNIEFPLIAVNGSMIYDPKNKEVLYFKSIKPKIAKKILAYLENNKMDYLGYTDKMMVGCNVNNPYWFNFMIYPKIDKSNPYRWNYHEGFYANISDQYSFGKFLLITEKINPKLIDNLKELVKKYSKDIYLVESQKGVIDIMPQGVSKGDTLKKLAQLKHIDLSRCVAFGDADNDKEMISNAGFGVAMGNAVEQTKKVAKFITKNNNEDGIAHFIEMLVNNEKS